MLKGKKIYLVLLDSDRVDGVYAKWLSDPEINQYLESRWMPHSVEDLKQYVKSINNGINNFLFGIYDINNHRHIGNIKIGDINIHHRHGDIGLLIGEKEYWGKGIGSEAVGLCTKYAFLELDLNKVTAGMYENNLGSYQIFVKNGFREVGRLRKHVFFKGNFIDGIKLELLQEDWQRTQMQGNNLIDEKD